MAVLPSPAPHRRRGLEDVTSVLALSSGGDSFSVVARERDRQTASLPVACGRGFFAYCSSGVSTYCTVCASLFLGWVCTRFFAS